MKIDSKPYSILSLYQLYRTDRLKVNRKYQRKLVWTIEEKQKLIDSIMNGYPVPLILLAISDDDGFEIIDGLQRLNAIFAFVENEFDSNEKYFNVASFPLANQISAEGKFESVTDTDQLFSHTDSVFLLNYEIPVTVLGKANEQEITDVFGRINSYGRQLSDQERRQAGVITKFSQLIRKLATEIRGDVSDEVVLLTKVPSISTKSKKEKHKNYSIIAEDVFWVAEGVLDLKSLRESNDEELLADICASIISNNPFKYSKETIDEIYEVGSSIQKDIERKLGVYGSERLIKEVQITLSCIEEILKSKNKGQTLKSIVREKKRMPAIRQQFYAIFMAFHKLLFVDTRLPGNPSLILKALDGCDGRLQKDRHYTDVEERRKNITTIYGLIAEFFVDNTDPNFSHGPGLTIDIRNMLTRSEGGESRTYELKQGLYNLSPQRQLDKKLLNEKIPKSLCAIANSAAGKRDGFFIIGVADKEADANKISQLDEIVPDPVSGVFVVGIDRELSISSKSIDDYLRVLNSAIENSKLPDSFKSQIISNIDHFKYNDKTIVVIKVCPQNSTVIYNGNEVYIRKDSSTCLVDSLQEILILNDLFKK